MKRTCLITGAHGLVGTHLLPWLAEYELYAVAREADSEWQAALPGHCRLIEADLSLPGFCDKLPGKVDAVIHLAQSNHFRLFPDKALDIAAVNTFSTVQLLDYAKRAGARHFVYASTGGVYPAGPERVCVEAEPLAVQQQAGMYYASKLSAELFVEAYSRLMTTVVLRFFFIYGPGQRQSMLIPRLVQSVMEGRPIALQGDNGIRINPVYVSDAVRAVAAALQLSTSAVVNVAGPEVWSLRDIGHAIAAAVGKPALFQSDLEVVAQDLVADVGLMRQLLVSPAIGLREGLALYVQETLPMMARDYVENID